MATEQRPTHLIGWHSTPFQRDRRSTVVELVLKAVEGTLKSANVNHSEVDYIITSSVDLWDGRTASNIAITEVVGAIMKGEARVAADGLIAAIHADMAIRSGNYQTVLVVAHCKESEVDSLQKLSEWTFDPLYLQPLKYDQKASLLIQESVRRGETIESSLCDPEERLDGAIAFLLSNNPDLIDRKKERISFLSTAVLTDVHYPGKRDFARGIFSQVVKKALHEIQEEDLTSFEKVALSEVQSFQRGFYQDHLRDLHFEGTQIFPPKAPFMVRGLGALLSLIESDPRARRERWLAHGQSGVSGQSEGVVLLEVDHGA